MYGLDIYLPSGVKLLSTTEMGVAFDIAKSGQNVDYNNIPNSYSQVEFPLSPIMGFWADSEQGVVNQFNDATSEDAARKLCENTYTPGSITYTNGHITNTTANLLGLTNTINSPASPLIQPKMSNYGFWSKGSLINVMQDMYAYMLKSTYTQRSRRMWMKLGKVKFNSPTMHLLVLNVSQNEVAALYPADFSKAFSIGLFSKTASQEIYVIFSEADFIDIQVQVYCKLPPTPIYPPYGFETYRSGGSITFTSRNPPLLPVFVTDSASINSIPSAGYKLGCVFSRVDTFVYGRSSGATACCVFNGISWVHGSKWASAMMGFTGGGDWSSTDKSRQYRFTMGTFDSNTWDWMSSRKANTTESAYVRYSLPYFAKDRGINKDALTRIGVFMGVVVY